MKTNAKTLRKLVKENGLTLGRVSKKELGEDYDILTNLYTNALDAITEWASKDYAHKTDKAHIDCAYDNCKVILDLYTTDDDRIIIDQVSMRTLRDLATKPKRLYSEEYKKAHKALKDQQKIADGRYDDIITLGAVERENEEPIEDYLARVEAQGLSFIDATTKIDMLDMYKSAVATLVVKTKKVEEIKAKGNWTWKRPVAVNVNEFAELFENYIADCLIDGYNIKPSKVIRDEKQAERDARNAEKVAAKK